jgi:hypothetical protein
MKGKVVTSCLLFLLSACAHAAESNLRGGSRSLAPEPEPDEAEQFRLVKGEINPLTTFQQDATTFPPNPTKGSPFRPDGETTIAVSFFQFSTDFTGTTTSPSIQEEPFHLDPTKLSQFGSPNLDTEPPSIPVEPFQLDPTKLSQFSPPNLDTEPLDDKKVIGGLGLGSLLVGGKDSCPKGTVGFPCTREYAPLSCGGCAYNNACLAEAAGFSEGQCKQVPVP